MSDKRRYQKRYEAKQEEQGFVRISAYVPAGDREKALKQLKKLRDAARKVA